jgi:hypothetical protein
MREAKPLEINGTFHSRDTFQTAPSQRIVNDDRGAIENNGPACCGFGCRMTGSHVMRRLLLAALLGGVARTQPSAAETPYDYPWCALRADRSGAQSCYYTSHAQCVASLRGIDGTGGCNPYHIRGPRYRGVDRY